MQEMLLIGSDPGVNVINKFKQSAVTLFMYKVV